MWAEKQVNNRVNNQTRTEDSQAHSVNSVEVSHFIAF